jgi:hypothetical protein
MSTPLRIAFTFTAMLVIAMPVATLAQRAGGARQSGGANHAMPVGRTAPAYRPAPPQARPAPPQSRPAAPNGGGFNFNRDINDTRPAPAPAPAPVPRHVTQPGTPGNTVRRTAPVSQYAPNSGGGGGPSQRSFHGPVVANPRHWGGAWQWNRGVTWQPASPYWGGGFWGPFALDDLAGAILFGAINDDENHITYRSYQVEPDSPGAQLLQNYDLQQVPCGPDGLVVIWGPDNSAICAFPNTLVAPGNYELDPTTLTIVSQ